MPPPEPLIRDLLRLTLTPGLGPVLIARLLEVHGTPDRVLRLSAGQLEQVRGIGPGRSTAIVAGMKEAAALVEPELSLAERLGIRLIGKGDVEYPALLAEIPDAPPLLYVRGSLNPSTLDRYPVAVVGSRACTAYGIEQAERFAGVLGRSGLTVVSGGARGIDTAAHRGSVRSGGRTMAILGCGLAKSYPPENEALFDAIVTDGTGAIISELPLNTAPDASNFPARNRIISGMCLGVIVIEAGRKSGALITARLAAEDHGREVMAIPGRVDSAASAGSLDLIKQGGAALVTDPADVLALLETPARHAFVGTHASRYGSTGPLFESAPADAPTVPQLSEAQSRILASMEEATTVDELFTWTGLSPETLRSELTLLEIQGRVVRDGARIRRAR